MQLFTLEVQTEDPESSYKDIMTICPIPTYKPILPLFHYQSFGKDCNNFMFHLLHTLCKCKQFPFIMLVIFPFPVFSPNFGTGYIGIRDNNNYLGLIHCKFRLHDDDDDVGLKDNGFDIEDSGDDPGIVLSFADVDSYADVSRFIIPLPQNSVQLLTITNTSL